MCTIVFLYQMLDDYPVIMAENRDAELSSTELPPSLVSDNPKIYAALDDKSGGTWLGLNEFGVAVGLTNLHQESPKIKPEFSRGRLCLDALGEASAEKASELIMEKYKFRKYAKASIVTADKEEAFFTICDKETNRIELESGIHLFANYGHCQEPVSQDDTDSMIDSSHRIERASELLSKHKMKERNGIGDITSALQTILCDHKSSEDSRASRDRKYFTLCCHGNDSYPWKTTSSSILALSKYGIEKSTYLYCAGNPCESEFADYSFIFGQ